MGQIIAPFRRLGRFLLWRYPTFYRRLGLLRDRGDCCADDFELWIDGFPRSAQTFASKSFLVANPHAKVRSHQHLPPFIINAIEAEKPGMLLIRKPEDAVVSWAIFWEESLGPCLDYYIDFHRALLPNAERAFKARFEDVTRDFGGLIHKFNQRFGTDFRPPDHDSEAIFSLIKAETNWHDPELDRRRICCPSADRVRMKAQLMKELTASSKMTRGLDKARKLYYAIAGNEQFRGKAGVTCDTRQLPV